MSVYAGRFAPSQLDVIVGNDGSNTNEVHVNDGFGIFTLVAGTSMSRSDTRAIAVLDMDNDGDVRARPRALNQKRRQQPRYTLALLAANKKVLYVGSHHRSSMSSWAIVALATRCS